MMTQESRKASGGAQGDPGDGATSVGKDDLTVGVRGKSVGCNHVEGKSRRFVRAVCQG